MRYSAAPPTVEEIVLVMCHAGDRPHGLGCALMVVMWRAGPRIGETLALTESDLDADRGAIIVCYGYREEMQDQLGALGRLMGLQDHLAQTLRGLVARIAQRLLALTPRFYLNTNYALHSSSDRSRSPTLLRSADSKRLPVGQICPKPSWRQRGTTWRCR